MNYKKHGLITFILALIIFAGSITSSHNVFASSPQQLYEQVWKLINSKYVDYTNNHQDWKRWRNKYDHVIKTDEDAYVAIETMLASLNDPYTKFLDPKEFAEETSSIKGSLKGIGQEILYTGRLD